MSKELISTIGKGTIVTSVGAILVKVVGIGATFLTLHRLTVYEYGLTELAISVIPLLSIFLLPGLANVVIAEMGIAKGEGKIGKAKALFNDFFRHQLFFAVFGWATVFLGAGIIAHLYNQNIADLFRIASFSFLLGPFRTNFLAALRVDLKFSTISAFGIVEECVKIAVLSYSFFVLGLSMEGVLYAYVLNEVITLTLFSPVFFSVYRSWGKADTDIRWPFRVLFAQHGKWGMITNYLNNFATNIRIWIIKFFFGAEAVGLYSLAVGLYSHVTSLFQLGTVITPILPQYVNDPVRFDRLVTKGIKYQIIGYFVSAIFAGVGFPILAQYLFPQFLPALPLFYLLLLAILPNSIAVILTPMFGALRAQKSLFFSTASKAVSIVFFVPLCLSVFGLFGASIEFFITMTIFTYERYRSLKKKLPWFRIRMKDLFTSDQDDAMIVRKALSPVSRFFSKH